jgi:hypothetical protein
MGALYHPATGPERRALACCSPRLTLRAARCLISCWPPSRAGTLRWSWTELVFSLSERKFVIARRGRPELAHLTVGWGHPSGAIDVHLTFGHDASMATGVPKDHRPLFVVTADMLTTAGQVMEGISKGLFVPFFVKRYRRFRPGWLERRGYAVSLLERETLQPVLDQVAPWERKKYRIDLGGLRNPAVFAHLGESLYHPDVLHCSDVIALGKGPPGQGSVMAIRPGSPGLSDSIVLHYGPDPRGIHGWCGFTSRDVQALSTELGRVFYGWVASRVSPQQAEVFERVVDGLALRELEDVRPMVDGMVAFLRNPGQLPEHVRHRLQGAPCAAER